MIITDPTTPPKKRRLHGACDACKKKKVKCDSAEMPDNRCTNCSTAGIQCTHAIPRQPKKKETQQAYIERLEDRLERMQRFLQTAFPDQDIDDIIEGTPGDNVRDASLSPSESSALHSNYLVPNSNSNFSSPSLGPEDASETDDLAHIALIEDVRQLSITTFENRFFGQSSGFLLARATTTAKNELTGTDSHMFKVRRPIFWDIRPWEKTLVNGDEPRYMYPEQDLLWNLVSLFFERTNLFLPLLHRPTFEKSLAAGQHLWDPYFGMTVLLVCANASRYSEDPRVTIACDSSGLSSGWKYFCQVPIYRNTLLGRSTLYDLQYYCLAIIYFQGTSLPNAAWSLLGLGVRLAVERGIHRQSNFSKNPQAEQELLKRSFWCLICMDRVSGSFLGRACLLMDEDFDVDYPIECDDEYWEPNGNSGQAFQQPSGKPSIITTFVYKLRLCEILASTLRTLYSTKKSKIRSGLIGNGNEWEHQIVAELDSSLNNWKDSLPEILRWDPNQKDSTFFHQTVFLYSTFFYTQIQVHRPFLTKKSDLSLVSLAICTNAARCCIHLLEVALTRGLVVSPIILMATFTSGLIIIFNVWGGQKSGLLQNAEKEMANVQICLNVLREGEKRWHLAGRLYDLLKEIGSLNEQPGLIADHAMHDLSSRKSGNENPPVSNSAYPIISPRPINLPNMPPAPNSKPIGATTPHDWDLNDLLPSQMDANPAANPALLPTSNCETGGWYVDFNNAASQGWAAPSARGVEYEMMVSDELMDYTPLMYPNNAEMLSLWAEASATFSGEEWDAYIANINQTLTAV